MKSKGFGFETPYEGKTNDWITPRWLVEALGEFDLDPCASVKQPWALAKKSYTPPKDGLSLPWKGRVFCNPPYGPNVAKWAIRMKEHGNGILLIFSRTDTKAWEKVWKGGDAFLFLTGRIRFYLPDGQRAKSGTAPSVLVAYGQDNVVALRHSKLVGAFFTKVSFIEEGTKEIEPI